MKKTWETIIDFKKETGAAVPIDSLLDSINKINRSRKKFKND